MKTYLRPAAPIRTLVMVLMLLMFSDVHAQATTTVLTLNLPGIYADDVLAEFENAHPGVDIVLKTEGFTGGAAAFDLDAHLDAAAQYASSADVLLVDAFSLTPESTLAGYFLDIAPLIQSDPNADSGAFYPAMWDAYQWNGGRWALPLSGMLELVSYDAVTLDAANLTYPDGGWSINDYANAARALARRGEDGQITGPGLSYESRTLFLWALLGTNLHDATLIPTAPDFSNPALAEIINTLIVLESEGAAAQSADPAPIHIGAFRRLLGNGEASLGGTLLPGGVAGMRVMGLAISAGTVNPSLAYDLIDFLVTHETFSLRTAGQIAARRDLPPIFNEHMPRFNVTEEIAALEAEAVEAALPYSDLLFFDYLDAQIGAGKTEAPEILQLAELTAREHWGRAAARRGQNLIIVHAPALTPVLGNDEITLRFLTLDTNPAWDDAIADFVAQDSQVGQLIRLETKDAEQGYDCRIFDQLYGDLEGYIDLAPLMQADVHFDLNDLFPGAVEMMTSGGVTLGYPLAISPDVIFYDVDWFNRMGVPLPDYDWTTNDFINTLHMLKPDANTPTPFGNTTLPMGGDNITQLVMAYSGLPMDSRTEPPTLNFTQPATMDAVRQVLDLARAGYIDFPETSIFSPGAFVMGGNYPIWSGTSFGGIWTFETTTPQRTIQMTLYPQGSAYAPISYRVVAGFIHADSVYPEACYRWLSYLSTRPDVMGIPAKMSQAERYATLSGMGMPFLDFYEAMRERASDPASRVPQRDPNRRLIFDTTVRAERAYRQYIFENVPLENALLTLEQDTETFYACMAGIPSNAELRQLSEFDIVRYDGIMKDCRRAYVPEIMWMFGG